MDQSLLPNIYDFISNTYPFSLLKPLEKDAVAAAVKISYHTPGDRLDNKDLCGAGLYMIRSGEAEEINKSDRSLRARLGAGDTFGYTQIDREGESEYEVIFPENTLLYFIGKQVLQFLILKNTQVGEYFNSKEWVRIYGASSFADEPRPGHEHHGVLPAGVGEICRTDVPTVEREASITDTCRIFAKSHGHLAVVTDQGRPCGIVSSADVAVRAVAAGLDCTEKVERIMSPGLVTVDAAATSFEALELMVTHNVRTLPVMENGALRGVITTTELMRDSTLEAVYLIRDVRNGATLADLAKISSRTRGIFQAMLSSHLAPHTVERLLSRIADSFYRRIVELCLIDQGPSPCPFCVVATGSLARREIQLMSDQDNAIITSRDLTDPEKAWFHELSEHICIALRDCGYPLCDGGYMASNPKWCQSIESWETQYAEWIADTSPKALLDSMVFLDVRCVYGDEFLANRLKLHLLNAVGANSRFLATLCAASTTATPPLGTFRKFVLIRDGTNAPYLNIKSQAVNLLVQLARLYALAAGSGETDTYSRLQAAANAGLLSEEDRRELSEALTFLNSVRLRHQLEALRADRPLTNNLAPAELSQFERNHLRDAFRIIARHQSGARLHFMKTVI